MNKIQSIMKTLLEKTKDILKEGIIIPMVISVLFIVSLLLCACNNSRSRATIIDPQIKMLRDRQTLVFYTLTDGKDTCLLCDFLDSFYERLKSQNLNQESFDAYYSMKVLNNEVIDVSKEYYEEQKRLSIIPVDTISKLFENYGIINFVYYLDSYPINKLSKDDVDSFIWAAYLLWQNNYYVSLADELNYWYIWENDIRIIK